MGMHPNVTANTFPPQVEFLGERVSVAFHYNIAKSLLGTIVRYDAAPPWNTIIRLDDGRHVLATECQYTLLPRAPEAP